MQIFKNQLINKKIDINKLYNVKSIIDFGSLKGEKMFMIYRLRITYLEWIIKKTDVCFADLTEFYKYGKIKQFNPLLSVKKVEYIKQEVANNPILKENNKLRLMTIKNLNNLIEKKHLTSDDFIDIDYRFSEELFTINSEKIKNCSIGDRNQTIENIYNHNFFFEH